MTECNYLTLQGIFDIVVTRGLKQGIKSYSNELGGCQYRLNTLKCFVGQLILDDYYDARIEGLSPELLPFSGFEIHSRLEDILFLSSILQKSRINMYDSCIVNLLKTLQNVHDCNSPDNWISELK